MDALRSLLLAVIDSGTPGRYHPAPGDKACPQPEGISSRVCVHFCTEFSLSTPWARSIWPLRLAIASLGWMSLQKSYAHPFFSSSFLLFHLSAARIDGIRCSATI